MAIRVSAKGQPCMCCTILLFGGWFLLMVMLVNALGQQCERNQRNALGEAICKQPESRRAHPSEQTP